MDTELKSAEPLTAAGKLLAEQKAALLAVEAEEKELMAPILARIEELRAGRLALIQNYAVELGVAIEAFSFEDLTDPFRSMEFSAAYWNSGYGVQSEHRNLYRKVFGEGYIFDGTHIPYGSAERDRLYYTAPRVGIPTEKDESLLALTAEKLAAVHSANMAILGEYEEARIEVFDDGLSYRDSYSIRFDRMTLEWVLEAYGELKRDAELIEILRVTPTYQ